MSDKEVSHEESMKHAAKYMRRFTRKEIRDENHLLKDIKREEKHSKQHDVAAESVDAEHIERDIYKFLFHNIRVMNSLIQIEKDQDFVENQEHFKNPYRAKIAREVVILMKELRRIGALDKNTE